MRIYACPAQEAFMKTMFVLLLPLAAALTACQSAQMRAPEQSSSQREGMAASGASGSAGSATASGAGAPYGGETAGLATWTAMCAQSRRIMNASTLAERQALMEQAMPDMPQQSRERHLEMMRRNCR
jgi:hypothetical protein